METVRAEHGGLASWDKRHKKEEERNTPVLAQICRLATVIVISTQVLNPAHSHNTKPVITSASEGIGSVVVVGEMPYDHDVANRYPVRAADR